MIQVSLANNPKYNTDNLSLELKSCMELIATTENLREQLVSQIYLITNIQKAINDNSIEANMGNLLHKYNDSISHINGSILSSEDKVSYFDIEKEKSSYEKQKFTMNLAKKCQEVEIVFDKVAQLNAKAIQDAKEYVTSKTAPSNVSVNNMLLQNKAK